MNPKAYAAQFGGDASIYSHILSLTDCNELRREHERARNNSNKVDHGSPEFRAEIGYMLAATDRLWQLDCEWKYAS